MHLVLGESENRSNNSLKSTQEALASSAVSGEILESQLKSYRIELVSDFLRLSSVVTRTDQKELASCLSEFLTELTTMLETGSGDRRDIIISNVGRVNENMSIEASFEIFRVLISNNLISKFTNYKDLHAWLDFHGTNVTDLINVVKLILSKSSLLTSTLPNDAEENLLNQLDENDYFKDQTATLKYSDSEQDDTLENAQILSIIVLFIHAAYMYMQYFRALKDKKDTRINPNSLRERTIQGKVMRTANPVVPLDVLLSQIVDINTEASGQKQEDSMYGAAFEVYKDLIYALKASKVLSMLEDDSVNNQIEGALSVITSQAFIKGNIGESAVMRHNPLIPIYLKIYSIAEENLITTENRNEVDKLIQIAVLQKIQEKLIQAGINKENAYKLTEKLRQSEEISKKGFSFA